MSSKSFSKLAVVGAALLPALVSAQNAFNTAQNLLQDVRGIVQVLIPIVFALAILGFFYGIMLYVFSTSGESKKDGKNIMIWALVAVFVMASLFGIIQLAQSTLGINGDSGTFNPPQVNI